MGSLIKLPEVITSLAVAAITGIVAVAWQQSAVFTIIAGIAIAVIAGVVVWYRRTKILRRVGWSVIYNGPVNYRGPMKELKRVPPEGEGRDGLPDQGQQQEMWKIVYIPKNPNTNSYNVKDGSLVIVEVLNIGGKRIHGSFFECIEGDDNKKINFEFPGRRVVHFKIRDNDEYRKKVKSVLGDDGIELPDGEIEKSDLPQNFSLPGPDLDVDGRFQVMVLLVPEGDERLDSGEDPAVKASIDSGVFKHCGRMDWPLLRKCAVGAGAVLIAAGALIGFQINQAENTPSPVCAKGSLDIEGSTAFAPIMNQAANDYERKCPNSYITISAGGSIPGLRKLQSGVPVLAMYDGDPGPLASGITSQPAGIVVFAMVGNKSLSSSSSSMFTVGLTSSSITQMFGGQGDNQYRLVGRTTASGTRQVFKGLVGQDDAEENGRHECPSPGIPASSLCLEDTTMDMLAYVENTPDTIGYAESDAVSFFPEVGTIPIDGSTPTSDHVLSGGYKFWAAEHLLVNGKAGALAKDLVKFLKSDPESKKLGSEAYIPCQNVSNASASNVKNACAS